MGEKKDDYIKIRVTTEMKQMFKEAAPGGDMSKLIIACTEPIAKQRLLNKKYESYTEARSRRTDEKLMGIRAKMLQRGNKKK